ACRRPSAWPAGVGDGRLHLFSVQGCGGLPADTGRAVFHAPGAVRTQVFGAGVSMKISAKYRTLIILALIIALAPLFFPSAYYFRVGSTLFVNAIAVMGIVILTGYAGQIS